MQLRHELKHEISMSDMIAIRQRMRAIAKSDPHAIDGKYFIRSLYFDTPEDRALIEKQSGISQRQKFRIRYYNYDTSVINLEKKLKSGGLGCKISAGLDVKQAEKIVNGDTSWMMDSDNELIRELYSLIIRNCLFRYINKLSHFEFSFRLLSCSNRRSYSRNCSHSG